MSIQMLSIAPRRRGFALVELAVVVVILVLLLLIASLLAPDARRRARLAGSIQNLQQLGKGYSAFASDHENRVASFDWTPGEHDCDGFVFPAAPDALQTHADQAVCIMRRLSGRTDLARITGWAPYFYYNHLRVMDYLAERLPSPILVSAGDAPRLAWQRAAADAVQDPADQGAAYFRLACRPAGTGAGEKRWAYSSSYELQPSFFSPDSVTSIPGGGSIPTVAQSPMGHRWYTLGAQQTVLGARRFDEVAFPSHKAFAYETNQRFFGTREVFFMYAEARVPVLGADGSASVRSIAGANRGFQPNLPQSLVPTRVAYAPEPSWETRTLNGGTSEIIEGRIRWTRAGLAGRDFQGPDVGIPPP